MEKYRKNISILKPFAYIVVCICFSLYGCSPRYGQFIFSPRNRIYGSFVQLERDSTFIYQHWFEWVECNSFGTWSTIPNKKNHILLKSYLSDYTRIPIEVVESQDEKQETTIILQQGAKFYNCEFNEVLANGETTIIDRDTIVLPICRLDSLSIRLGYSKLFRKQVWGFSPKYDSICTQTYFPKDSTSNVFKVSLPIFPYRANSKTDYPKASNLFLYIPMNKELFYDNGKWYEFEHKRGISYKQIKMEKSSMGSADKQ